ncbi:mCG130772 [Mus musculus]|nr:mCG130772 [Mus musculus]
MGQFKSYKILTVGLVFLVLVLCFMMPWPEPMIHWLPQPSTVPEYVSESIDWDSLPQELPNLTSLLYWPPTGEDRDDFLASTSPRTSTYCLKGPAHTTFTLGSNLEAILVARDHRGRAKVHGGDLFRAQLLGPELRAGVPGEVKDLKNGTYLLSFPLLWAGRAQVQVRLIHSSEAVRVLQRVWREKRATVDFRGYFRGTDGPLETVICNVDPPVNWSQRAYLPVQGCGFWGELVLCSTLYFALQCFSGSLKWKLSEALPSRPPCSPGHLSPKPSGFYYQDRWHSTFCSSRSFPTVDSILNCLAGRIVYMLGDSTLRQWWEYLRDTVPSLKPVDLHVTYQVGPLMAVETTRGTVLHWRAHSWPLRSLRTPVASLHSVARELHGLAGGPYTVVVLGIGAHFTTFPPSIFARRLVGIRAAVKALLDHEPSTLVIIKLANTGYKSVYGSDWLTLQVNRLLRAAFVGLRVAFVDAWEMTSTLNVPDNIHPRKLIVRNEVELFLSFICST